MNKYECFDEKALDPEAHYSKDKPISCYFCYWWDGRNKGCGLPKCDYLIKERPVNTDPYDCKTCPYGRDRPCIGYCIKKIKDEMQERWRKVVKECLEKT